MTPEFQMDTFMHPAQAGRLARVVITGAAASDPVKKARLAVRRPSSVRGLAFGGFPSSGVMTVDTLHLLSKRSCFSYRLRNAALTFPAKAHYALLNPR